MLLDDSVKQSISKFPCLYYCENYEKSKFQVLHQYFIILGNGFDWANTENPEDGGYLIEPKYVRINGEWERDFDLPYGHQKFSLDSRFFKEKLYELWKKHSELELDYNVKPKRYFESEIEPFNKQEFVLLPCNSKVRIDPYPNFDKKYSCFWRIDPKLIKPDWKSAGIDHLLYWKDYFNDPERMKGFSWFIDPKSLKRHIEKTYKDKSPCWMDSVALAYEFPDFNGENYEDMACFRWNKQLQEIKDFISDSLTRLGEIKMRFVVFGDIVESNGKTIRQNNLEKEHKFKIGDLVEACTSKFHGNGSSEIIKGHFFIVDLGRDCDGTPLYSLSTTPRDQWANVKITVLHDDPNKFSFETKEVPNNKMSHGQMIFYNVMTGFSEDSLTKIENDDKIKKGYGSMSIPYETDSFELYEFRLSENTIIEDFYAEMRNKFPQIIGRKKFCCYHNEITQGLKEVCKKHSVEMFLEQGNL